jgi:hypothetical protein
MRGIFMRLLASRRSSVGVATGYELDGLGSIPGIARLFRPSLGPTQVAI